MKTILTAMIWLAASLAVGLTSSSPAQAQAQSVVVQRRDADIAILANADVQVAETWQVQFNGGPFHTAFRSIPLNRVQSIGEWGLSEGSQVYTVPVAPTPDTFTFTIPSDNPAGKAITFPVIPPTRTAGQFEVQSDGLNDKITWDFPPTTNASRTFTLHYTLHGPLRIYPGGDQFWWKFIEADRGYTIESSHITVTLPAAFSPDQILSATYPSAGTTQPGSDGKTVTFDGGPFPAGTEWEIRTQFPHGVLSASAPPWQAEVEQVDQARVRADEQAAQARAREPLNNLMQLAGGILALIAGLAIASGLYFTRTRQMPIDFRAEYLTEPPDSLTPALAGALVDNAMNTRGLIATLVDLARRGLVRMSALSGGDYLFERVKDGESKTMRPYEKDLLDEFFGGAQKRNLSSLRGQFGDTQEEFRGDLGKELVHTGYLSRVPSWQNDSSLNLSPNTIIRGAFLGLIVLFFLVRSTSLQNLTLPNVPPLTLFDLIVVGGVVAINAAVLAKFRPSHKTAQGALATAKWQAFKRYLQNIHRYTNVAEATQLFEKYLPYAIVFGVEERWVDAFKTVNTPAPTWYHWADYDRGRAFGQEQRASASSGSGGRVPPAPSLDQMASGAFRGLDSMSTSFFGMLNSAADVLTSAPPSSSRSSSSRDGSSGSDSGGGGGWSGGGDSGGGGSSSSSDSGGGGGGGGSSGFG